VKSATADNPIDPLLLTPAQAARVLGIGRATFYRALPRLVARGLQSVQLPGGTPARPITRYTAASLRAMVARDAGEPATRQRKGNR